MKISIIVPFYNAAAFMRPCIGSILSQTFSGFELVCVDDCSTDGTYGILEEYAASDSRKKLLDFLKSHPRIKVQSVYSHLAASDEARHDSFTLGQIELYSKMAARIDAILDYRPLHHILNSAGIERFTEYQFDMVRLGIGIYGISATGSKMLKPAATLRCKILQIKELQPSDGTVGYGRHGKLHPEGITKTATLPLGYADGIDRHLGRGNARFLLNGKLVPTIGNICMDMCMIDITGVDAKVGDTVTIFGERPHASELATILGTIPYEIFTSVAKRVKRVVIK